MSYQLIETIDDWGDGTADERMHEEFNDLDLARKELALLQERYPRRELFIRDFTTKTSPD